MKNSGMTFIIAVAIMVVATVAAHGERPNIWWAPTIDQFGYSDGITSSVSGDQRNMAWVHATTERDIRLMLSLVELFPPYMFDSDGFYLPGTERPASDSGYHKSFGYRVLVDAGDLTFVVTKDRAEEIAGSRIMAYLLIRELASMWAEHSGHKNVTVSFAYVPNREDPVVFAIGFKTKIGVKVVMAE